MRPTLTHFALHVADPEACLKFYRDFCALEEVHRRGEGEHTTVWLAEPGREHEFVFVFIAGGARREQAPSDFSHLGFALTSRAEVDAVASRAAALGILAWPPRQERYPVGYYCGVRDPEGRVVEFSYGQPLGPGAESAEGPALGAPAQVE
ncbi:MAG: VOC family protein [Planctomycetes bacterium]|nr:VOC family protein [Planctomycetota bacterium]